MKKKLKVPFSKQEYIATYVKLLNGVFDLTPRELQALTIFLQKDLKTPATTPARKAALEQMKLTSPMAINNLVKSLRTKGAILGEPGDYQYHPILRIDKRPAQLIYEFDEQV